MNKIISLGWPLWLLIQLSSPATADECLEGDCDNGRGTGFTEAGKIYRGEWQKGRPHGWGRLTLSKDKFIEGRWEKGELIEEKREMSPENRP